ncbi:ABC transporter ATP-binding protein [Haloarcula brevis]|uniref:ABC transporter ATP-binding protein n=1 Tax=Haloarcula brevis TaxID=3111453 RepID=UPI00300EE6B3
MSEHTTLRMEGIRKEFPGVVANDHVDLSVERGEIHGLLGENGAGKSTLMKILYGLYSQDAGDIYLDGERLDLGSPQDAIDAGIGMVHQHFMLIPRLTVAENVVLGEREPATAFRDDAEDSWLPAAVRNNGLVQSLAGQFSLGLDVPEQRIQALADQYGFDIDVSAKIWELDVGQQQRVEILKALYRDVDLLILDEPTAVLTPTEAERLFDSLERLTDEGLSIIFITHKLTEVDAIVDRVTVLREGQNVGTAEVASVSRADLAEMMVGREVLFEIDREAVDLGEPVLRARGVTADDDRGIEALSGVDLTVRQGEIVGIAGVSGNGQKELAEVMAGIRDVTAGELVVDGEDITGAKPKTFVDSGVSFVPEDRLRYGCAEDLSVMHNATMKDFRDGRFGDRSFLDYGALREYAETLVEEFDVRGVSDVTETEAGDLSGGNLQKLILAREIHRDPDLLIANQPTRGVDVGAIEFIRETLLEQRKAGTGIILLSEDLDEIFDLSDRILVVYEGEFVYETTPAEADRERIGLEMTGGGGDEGGEPVAVQSGVTGGSES